VVNVGLKPRGAFVAAALLAIALSGTARGALVAYDGFDYAPAGSPVNGKSGGGSFGFVGPWAPGGFNASISDNYEVAIGSLSFGNLLTSGGRVNSGAVQAIAGLTRDFAVPVGTAGTTRYYSFLLRPEGSLNAGAFNGFFGVTLESPDEPEVYTGKPGAGAIGQYVIEDRGGANQFPSSTPAVVNQTAFFVVKAQFSAAAGDAFTLYVNPTPGQPEPATGIVKNTSVSTMTGFTIYSTGAFSVDELRLGETFADVTPVVPEPVAGAGLALAGTILLARRRAQGFITRAGAVSSST